MKENIKTLFNYLQYVKCISKNNYRNGISQSEWAIHFVLVHIEVSVLNKRDRPRSLYFVGQVIFLAFFNIEKVKLSCGFFFPIDVYLMISEKMTEFP